MRGVAVPRILKDSFRLQRKKILRLYRLVRKTDLRSRLEFLSLGLFLIALTLRGLHYIGGSGEGKTLTRPHDSPAGRYALVTNRSDIARLEAGLVEKYVCGRRLVAADVEELRLCGTFKPSTEGKKIVGLVEVRNVQRSIKSFLNALSRTVDSIVIIDDHSYDGSRGETLDFNAIHGEPHGNKKGEYMGRVEVLLRKTDAWEREELRDRELLLSTGRKVGGTHFVLLDYDEYLSANCVYNGMLRHKIQSLLPGESLYLPWVELWKSTALQRVLPGDDRMNFLTRRQVVIFADDRKFNYTMETSVARKLGSHAGSHISTIHALRCPRSICPRPARYTGPSSDAGYPPSVKTMNGCYIVEVRFLNINNVLLKSAWYEALGRVMGADDSVTSGKMVTKLFPKHIFVGRDSSLREAVKLNFASSEWLRYTEFSAELYNKVEIWRAEELLRWVQEHGIPFFRDLEAFNRIDLLALRSAVDAVRRRNSGSLFNVPRLKRGRLILVIESAPVGVASDFLRHMGWTEVLLPKGEDIFSNGLRLSGDQSHVTQYESWRSDVERKVHEAIGSSSFNAAFISTIWGTSELQRSLVELLRNEFPHLHVTILFATWTQGTAPEHAAEVEHAVAYAEEAGSHVKVIDVPLQSFGSFATLHWLRGRLSNTAPQSFTAKDNAALLDFAETVHRSLAKLVPGMSLLPVAKLIFSLNVGRSGSKYLAQLLGTVSDPITAQHEPRCSNGLCSGGGAMRMQDESLLVSYSLRRETKLPMIRRDVSEVLKKNHKETEVSQSVGCSDARARFSSEQYSLDGQEHFRPLLEVSGTSGCTLYVVRDVVYAETNPNFKSWFYDIVLDSLPSSGYSTTVIVVRKYIAAVVKSLYETGYFTSRDGYNWMETSAGVNSQLRTSRLSDDSKLDAYEKLTSYVLNAEATFRHIIRKYGSRPDGRVRFVETRSEQIFDKDGAMELLRKLGLRASADTMNVVGDVADKYRAGQHGLKKRSLKTSLVECERRVQKLVAEASESEPEVEQLAKTMDRVEGFQYAQ